MLALERNTLGLRADHPDRGELARLRRELRSLQVRPSDRDAEIDRLERRLLDLERQTDRVEARRQLDRSLELEGDTLQLAVPEAYRPPWPEDIRGQDRLIGVGKLVVRVQRSLRAGARELEVGRRSAATRHLADAERSLARLEPGFAVDPTTIALRAEAARLRARLTD